MITPEEFLKLTETDEEEDVFRLGRIGTVNNGKAHIIFDGEQLESLKAYLSVNYEPIANDRVLLARVKGTYLILGKIGVD